MLDPPVANQKLFFGCRLFFCRPICRQILLPEADHFPQSIVQIGQRFFLNPVGDAVGRFRNAAGDGGQGVAVAAQGNCIPDGVLKISAFQKGDDRLRDTALTGLVEPVVGADLVQCPGEIIVVFLLDEGLDPPLARIGVAVDGGFAVPMIAAEIVPAEEDGVCDRQSALDALWMVVGHFGGKSGQDFPPIGPDAGLGEETAVCHPAAGGDTHGRAVSEAVVWLAVIREEPGPESSAVSGVGVHPAILFHGIDEVVCRSSVYDCLGHRTGHDGVIGKAAAFLKQGKIFCLDVVPLVNRTNNVSNNCADHLCPPLFFMSLRILFRGASGTAPQARKAATVSLITWKFSSVPSASST